VASQAVLYILAFYNTYIFATINRILQQSNGSSPFFILMLHSLSLPMQGFWNFLIYRRPFYLNLRRSKLMPRLEAIQASLILSWFKGPNSKYTTGVSGVGRTSSDDQSRRSSLRLVMRRRSSFADPNDAHQRDVDNEASASGKDGEEKMEIEGGSKKKVTFAGESIAEDPEEDSESKEAETNDDGSS
jgi:hypothetical protein